jgi:ribosome-associated protein
MIEKTELLKSIIEGIQEKKGKNISAIQLKGMSGAICDYFVICEGNTPTQVSALANSIEEVVKKNVKENPIRVHGLQQAEWVGMDYGNVIVHIFLPDLRRFYNIDTLWEDAKSEQIPSL